MDKDQIKQKHIKEYRQIGLLIAYHRKLNGYTQQQLAKSINISRTHLSNSVPWNRILPSNNR